MKVLIAAAWLAIAAGLANAGEKPDTIKAFCANRWDDDFKMQVHCIEDQSIAAYTMWQLDDQFRKDPMHVRIYKFCLRRWKDEASGGYDWKMVSYCYGEQSKAAKTLKLK